VQVEAAQRRQHRDDLHAGVADLRAAEVELDDLRERLQRREFGVARLLPRDREVDGELVALLRAIGRTSAPVVRSLSIASLVASGAPAAASANPANAIAPKLRRRMRIPPLPDPSRGRGQ
jgi:hypothetical protein